MKILGRLAGGDVALWRVFWLIGMPLAVLWDVTGLSMLTGYGVEQPAVAILIILLFTAIFATISIIPGGVILIDPRRYRWAYSAAATVLVACTVAEMFAWVRAIGGYNPPGVWSLLIALASLILAAVCIACWNDLSRSKG